MSEKLLRQLIRASIIKENEESGEQLTIPGFSKEELQQSLPPQAGEVYVVNIPGAGRPVTIVADVSGNISGPGGIVIDLTPIDEVEWRSEKTHGLAINAKRENAKFVTAVRGIIESGSREAVGGLFEMIAEKFPGGGSNTNLPGDADYPFADLFWNDTYWSVKGTNSSKKKGIGSSMVKVGTLVTMLREKRGPAGAPIDSVGLISGNVSADGSQLRLVRYGPVDVTYQKVSDPIDEDGSTLSGFHPWEVSINLGGNEIPFVNGNYSKDGIPEKNEKGKYQNDRPLWKLKPGYKRPPWITPKEVFSSSTSALRPIFGSAAEPFITVKFDPETASPSRGEDDFGAYQSEPNTPEPLEGGERGVGPIQPGERVGSDRQGYPDGVSKKKWKKMTNRARVEYFHDDVLSAMGDGAGWNEEMFDDLVSKLRSRLFEQLLRGSIRGILKEELTGADRKEVDKLIKKGIERDRAEQKRIMKKEIEAELKTSLGKSFFGNPGKVRKAIEEIARDELSREMRSGSDMEKSVVEITKKVLASWHEMLYKQQNIINRIRIK